MSMNSGSSCATTIISMLIIASLCAWIREAIVPEKPSEDDCAAVAADECCLPLLDPSPVEDASVDDVESAALVA